MAGKVSLCVHFRKSGSSSECLHGSEVCVQLSPSWIRSFNILISLRSSSVTSGTPCCKPPSAVLLLPPHSYHVIMIHILLIISIVSISELELFKGNSSLNFHIIKILILARPAHKKGCNPFENNDWGGQRTCRSLVFLQVFQSRFYFGYPNQNICLRLMFL